MAEIRQAPVEGMVVYPIIYQGFIYPNWLFGISAINRTYKMGASRTLVIKVVK